MDVVVRRYSSLARPDWQLLRSPLPSGGVMVNSSRGVAMLIARVLRGALKIRYLVLGGTLAGGSALAKVWAELRNMFVCAVAIYYPII